MSRKKKWYQWSLAEQIYLMLCPACDVDCAESARWYHLCWFLIPPLGIALYQPYIAMKWEREQTQKRKLHL